MNYALGCVSEQEDTGTISLKKMINSGKAVILYNKRHRNLKPAGIGKGLRTKVNANIGTSQANCNMKNELKKLEEAIDAGTDTIMDLSTAGNLDEIRHAIIENCNMPVGTVPIYQAVIENGIKNLSIDSYLASFEKHAKNGVSFATVHAGLTKDALPLLEKRLMGVVSRGGAFIIDWMKKHNKENFLYEHFDDVLDIAGKYDVVLSLGDGLRPGCIEDETDAAQIHELKKLGVLAKRCREKGVQVIIEGPGHIPLHKIEKNIRLEKEHCNDAPFYVLGPLPTDIAPGYDHIVAAIGGAIAASYGADFLCYVTATEHIGLPNPEEVREGVIATRIAAHIGDIAKGIRGARLLDKKISQARANWMWNEMAKYSIDSKKFRELRKKGRIKDVDKQCSMCGEYCALKIYRQAQKK